MVAPQKAGAGVEFQWAFQDGGQKPDAVQRRPVAFQSGLGPGAAVDIIPDKTRQPTACAALQIL